MANITKEQHMDQAAKQSLRNRFPVVFRNGHGGSYKLHGEKTLIYKRTGVDRIICMADSSIQARGGRQSKFQMPTGALGSAWTTTMESGYKHMGHLRGTIPHSSVGNCNVWSFDLGYFSFADWWGNSAGPTKLQGD